jgi:uroporphyrinogen decarboxylase
MMNSRQRLEATITFQTPDRVPFDLGSTDVTGMHWKAYQSLAQNLKLSADITLLDPIQGLVQLPDAILDHLEVDTAGVWLNPALTPIDENHLQDEWGTVWRKVDDSLWYDPIKFPLQGASLTQVVSHPWPFSSMSAKLDGVADRARDLYENSSRALVANFSGALLARGQLVRGPADFLIDLLAEPEIAGEILDRILEVNLTLVEAFLKRVGKYIQVIKISDDIGAQNNLLISPAAYRKLIKPRQARFISAIHSLTDAKVLYHTDGAVASLIDDFIEIGVDILNPIQVTAKGMDTALLGERYAGKLVFWGAVDNQFVLSQGDQEEVLTEARRRISDLARTPGGYVLAASHNISPETPAINVITLSNVHRTIKSEV